MGNKSIALLFSTVVAIALSGPALGVDFARDIRPLLADRCLRCHGADAAQRQADLRLDQEIEAKRDRGGYAVVVPGRSEVSELILRIEAADPEERMPPPDAGGPLSSLEKQMLRDWVADGASWQDHWSFSPPSRAQLPLVAHEAWSRNPIDAFALATMQTESLLPSPRAPRERLIRRVTLDLTGVPPTLSEIDDFLQDTAPDAYGRLVDRLLSSPRYGEQMALSWLDAARYADTDGYQNDGPRSMWRWRDWVIAAYNDGLPFDQFTVEQLAGDLLPNATMEQKIATGFNRNHRYNSEAGLVLDEFLLENAVDRVDTMATVWMGLTVGCARCHDHKFDPISQSEYYSLVAFFDKVSESGRAVKFGNSEPWLVAPTPPQADRLAHLDRDILQAKASLPTAPPLEFPLPTTEGSSQPVILKGLTHHFPLDGPTESISAESGLIAFADGIERNAAQFDGSSIWSLGKVGRVQCESRSSISFWMRPEQVESGVILSNQLRNTLRPGISAELQSGKLQFFIITRWLAGVGAVETAEPIEVGRWHHIALTNDGSQSARGMAIFVDGRRVPTRTLFNTNSNTGGTDPRAELRLGGGVEGERFVGRLDDLRFYDRTLYPDEIAILAEASSLVTIAETPPEHRTPRQTQKYLTWWLEYAADPKVQQNAETYFSARQRRQRFFDELPTTMVMEELAAPRPTFVRVRGVYDQLGPRVEPGLPSLLQALSPRPPIDRLGMARWLVNGHHPLTARVAVNRYWQRFFGVGFVKTPEDFGTQGDLPSHLRLLDWLATEFVRDSWDIKAMQRRIVTSATYCQDSTISPSGLEHDPANRWLARGPRLRLAAHVIRDQALSVSGLLVEEIGGPSVSPYQPPGLWKEISNMTYQQSEGRDLYRRSLYTTWKRTVPPPSLAILDAADRESCFVGRRRTNTPLQALTLLNEPAFVEAARELGRRMTDEGGDQPIRFAFRLVTGREPRPRELEFLAKAHLEYKAELQRNPELVSQLLDDSATTLSEDRFQRAANCVLANVLLNLDETVTKG